MIGYIDSDTGIKCAAAAVKTIDVAVIVSFLPIAFQGDFSIGSPVFIREIVRPLSTFRIGERLTCWRTTGKVFSHRLAGVVDRAGGRAGRDKDRYQADSGASGE